MFLLLLLSLMLLVSPPAHVVGFSSDVDFPADSGGPGAVNIHDVPLIPAAVACLR
jgi:hypothetical protein